MKGMTGRTSKYYLFQNGGVAFMSWALFSQLTNQRMSAQ
jgi:hypothetical protein